MISYTIYVMRVEDGKQFLESKVYLHHLVPPVVEKHSPNTVHLLYMAMSQLPLDGSLQSNEGVRSKCDLVNMCLVEPPPKTERLVPRENGNPPAS